MSTTIERPPIPANESRENSEITFSDLSTIGERVWIGMEDDVFDDKYTDLLQLDAAQLATTVVRALERENTKDIYGSYLAINNTINTLFQKKLGEEDPYRRSPENQVLRKEFALGVIDSVKQYANNNPPSAVRELAGKIDISLLGGSPNIIDHIGDLDSQIDVAAASQEVPQLAKIVWEVRELAMQNITFTYNPQETAQLLADKVTESTGDPVRQLELLKFYDSLSQQAANAGYGEQAGVILSVVLDYLSRESENALSAHVARYYSALANARLEDEIGYISGREITDIGGDGFNLPEELKDSCRSTLIARDAVGIIDSYGIIRFIADENQEKGNSSETSKIIDVAAAVHQDEEKKRLLQMVHLPEVRMALETSIGVDLSEIAFQTQVQLLDYMVRRTPDEFARLSAVAKGVKESEGSTGKFYEAFLATEFGDYYGDILLSLAESADKKLFREVAENIEEVRRAGARIAEHFRSDDPLDQEIADRIPAAFIKRTTELLALAHQEGIEKVIEPLEAISEAVKTLADSLDKDTFSHAEVTPEFGAFSSDTSPVTVSSRPHGRNARLGFTVRGMGKDNKQRLNIRLDYEAGELSLDIGSTAKKDVHVSEIAALVGNTLARGEEALINYRRERQGDEFAETQLHGNHVREAFSDMPILQPEEFAGVVNRFMYRLRNRGRISKIGQLATVQQIAV